MRRRPVERSIALAVGLLVVSVAGGSAVALDSTAGPTSNAACSGQDGYEVTFTNVTIQTWRLLDVTAVDVVVREVHVENAEEKNGTATNATLENVSLRELSVNNATLSNVSADELTVRNRSILDVPGADLVGEISNRNIERHVLTNVTITGLVVDSLTISNLSVENRRLVQDATQRDRRDESLVDTIDEEAADIDMNNATIERADIVNTTGTNWALGNQSVENETISNQSEHGDDPVSCFPDAGYRFGDLTT